MAIRSVDNGISYTKVEILTNLALTENSKFIKIKTVAEDFF